MNIQQHFEFLLREGPITVFCCDPYTWTPNYISENIQKLLGFSAQAFFDSPGMWLARIHPEDRDHVTNTLKGILTRGAVTLENRIQHSDGHYIHVHSEMRLLVSEEGHPVEVTGFFLDLTESIQQKRNLERQQQQLVEANESLEQFVYIASHDLREPLVGLAGYSNLVQRRYADKLDDAGKGYLKKIGEACKNMEHKIDDLLELSRAGRGTPTGTFPLGTAVEQAKRSLSGPIGHTSAEIEFGELPVVRGDRGQIAQVFQNLFSNSMKYRKKDEKPVIHVTANTFEEDPSRWLIAVRDNGLGFDMRHAERIFGVFQRLYTFEEYPGTGIGLALVKKIVEHHDGQVWAESEPNCGSTFYLTLAKPET